MFISLLTGLRPNPGNSTLAEILDDANRWDLRALAFVGRAISTTRMRSCSAANWSRSDSSSSSTNRAATAAVRTATTPMPIIGQVITPHACWQRLSPTAATSAPTPWPESAGSNVKNWHGLNAGIYAPAYSGQQTTDRQPPDRSTHREPLGHRHPIVLRRATLPNGGHQPQSASDAPLLHRIRGHDLHLDL